MDSYEDLITYKDKKSKKNHSKGTIFFINPKKTYDINYDPISNSTQAKISAISKFPLPTDFSNYESYSKEAKKWMDSAISNFLQISPSPFLPIPTTIFYRTFNLEFWPRDKDSLRTLAKKLGPLLLPLRPKNLLELENKVINTPTNITSPSYNSNKEEIFQENNNFSEPDYNGRPLNYKYHFIQNDFFQLIPPEPEPDFYDSFVQYNEALKKWYRVTNENFPGYKKIKKVEEIGSELGLKITMSSTSPIKPISSRDRIDKMNEDRRKNLFKGGEKCTIDQLNSIFNTSLSQAEYDRLTNIDLQSFKSKYKLFSNHARFPSFDENSMTKIDRICFDEESLDFLKENNYEELSYIIGNAIDYGPSDYIVKYPIQNHDILRQFIFVYPNRSIKYELPPKYKQIYSQFPLLLLNQESPEQFIEYCEEKRIDFSAFVKTESDFANLIKLCDPTDKFLSQKFVYVFKNLFSSPTKFEIYVKALIGNYNPNDVYEFDMNSYELMRSFLKIVEGSGDFDDEKVPRMMYNLNLQIDEEYFINQKKKSAKSENGKPREFNRKEILNIYKLSARCAILYTFANLFGFKKWNSNVIFEYISQKVLNSILYKLAKIIQSNKEDIIACYINETIEKFDRNIKKAKQTEDIIKKDDDIGGKLMSFSTAFLTFSEASKSLSQQLIIPQRKSQLRIPIFVLNQDGNSSKKVNTIDDDQINDPQEKTLAALSSNDPTSQHPKSDQIIELVDEDAAPKNDSNMSPSVPHSSFDIEEKNNFGNLVQTLDNGGIDYFSNFSFTNSPEKDEVESTMNSLQHSILSMTKSFKSLPKDEDNDDDNNDDENNNDDYMKILSSVNTENKKLKKKKKKSRSGKKAKNIAYRIIFLIMNIDYSNLHHALFSPSPINFFNELSKLENGNAFMNLAGGFCTKTEKLKSMFLGSDAFKNLLGEIIVFNIPKLELTMVNFVRRALIILGQSSECLYSRSQVTSLLKSFTASVPIFTFVLCPIISMYFRNKENFLYHGLIPDKSSENFNNPINSSNSSILTSFDSLSEISKKTQRKSPLLSLTKEEAPAEPSTEPPENSRSGFRFKKSKRKKSFDDLPIEHMEAKAKSFDSNSGSLTIPEKIPQCMPQINDIVIGGSGGLSNSMFTKREPRRQPNARKNTDSILSLGGVRASYSFNFTDSENSDNLILARDDNKSQHQALKPKYVGEEWNEDATMVATYLASLAYSVNSSCFPYLLRSVDLLFCSPKIIFPRKFWGTFCGALSVAEINSWIFLRTVFKNGFIQILPPEFTLFFPAVFNYKNPHLDTGMDSKVDLKSCSNSSTSASRLTFENLNRQIEKAKQLSLKIMMFSVVVESSVDVSLQYLESLMLSDKSHLQNIFSNSVNPSSKIEKLFSSAKNQKAGAKRSGSSIDISLYSSSYQASLRNIVENNLGYYKKIVDKLKSFGNKFQSLISIFPATS